MLTNQEKTTIIQEKLSSLNKTQEILTDAVISRPNDDKLNCTPRADVLVDLNRIIAAFQAEISRLNA